MTVIDETMKHAAFCVDHEPAEENTEQAPCAGAVATIGGITTWPGIRGVYLNGVNPLGATLTADDAEHLAIALYENAQALRAAEAIRAAQVPTPRRPMDDEAGQ